MTPEAEVLAAAGGDLAPLSPAAAAVADAGGLIPLFGRRAGAPSAWAASYRETLARALHAQASTARLVARLGERGIPAIGLKGAALVELVYDSPGERPMGDVDLLVPAARWDEACAITGGTELVVEGRPITSRHDYCRAFRADGDVTFEIHRWLAPRPLWAVDLAGLFARAVRPVRAGAPLVPSSEDLLLSLCLHAAKHGFLVPLRAVLDTRRVVARLRPDGRLVANRARAWRATRATLAWLRRCGVADLVEPHLSAGSAPITGSGGRFARILLATDGPTRALGFLAQRAFFHLADRIRGSR